jgi:hypothetical protein
VTYKPGFGRICARDPRSPLLIASTRAFSFFISPGSLSMLVAPTVGRGRPRRAFIALLNRLLVYAKAPVIHVILDKHRIHDSKITQAAFTGIGGRIHQHR